MIFGIPITPYFYYLLRMPVALVQLMAIDQSIIVYPKDDEVKVGNKSYKFSKLTKDDIEATNARWEKRKKEIEEKKRLKQLRAQGKSV